LSSFGDPSHVCIRAAFLHVERRGAPTVEAAVERALAGCDVPLGGAVARVDPEAREELGDAVEVELDRLRVEAAVWGLDSVE
jgi:hypothetical protein